jgi:hypothetical protein
MSRILLCVGLIISFTILPDQSSFAGDANSFFGGMIKQMNRNNERERQQQYIRQQQQNNRRTQAVELCGRHYPPDSRKFDACVEKLLRK